MTHIQTPIPRARVARGIRRARDVVLIAATVLTLAALGAVVATYR